MVLNLDPKDFVAGSSSLVMGCDSYTSPTELGDTEFVMGQNVTCRGGIVQTRPGSRSCYCAPFGNFQGFKLFTPDNGVAHHVFAVDGAIYVSAAPFTSYRRLRNLQFSNTAKYISWAVCLKSTDYDNEGVLFPLDNPYSVLVIQDGLTRAGYWDGGTSGHLNPGSPAFPDQTDVVPGYNETPIGLWMIWSGNRLWVSRGNQIFAGDIGNPLKFTETIYLNEGRAFYLTGPCTGMIEVPADQAGAKGFIAFTETDGTLFSSYIQDRTTWLATPLFQNTILPQIGCVAPRSLITQYGLNWWFGPRGFTNINSALRQNITSRIDYQDNEMFASKAYLGPDLSGICGSLYENYLMLSVPSGDVLNRHTWVLDQAPFENNNPAWPGFWTGWRPIEWSRGIINGSERVFFASIDYDGKNRVWEAMLPDKTDNGCAITCYAQLRDHAAGNLDSKRYDWTKFFLSQIYGEVDLNVYVASTKGSYQLQKGYHIVANAGQIFSDVEYSEEGPLMIGNRVQTRTIRTPSNPEDNACNACGVESTQGNMIDYAFSHLLVWSGQMGIRAYQMHLRESPERQEGDCEEPEVCPRTLNAAGCSGLELFVDGQVFEPFTAYAEGATTTLNGGTAYIRRTAVSYISAENAQAMADCAVQQIIAYLQSVRVPTGVYDTDEAEVGGGSYVVVSEPAGPPCPGIISQPSDEESVACGTTSFSVEISSSDAVSYQWQVSQNGGSTWIDVSNSSPYSGANTNTLTINPVPINANGYLYRCIVSIIGCSESVSNSATLTVVNDPQVDQWIGYVNSNGGGFAGNSVDIAKGLVCQINLSGFGDKIKYLLPFLGTGIGAARAPLIDRLSAGSATNINFLNSDFSQSTGLQGNGTTKALDTNVFFTQLGISNQSGIGWWENNIDFSGNVHPIGNYSIAIFGQQRFVLDLRSFTRSYVYGATATNACGQGVAAINGHYYGQRNAGPLRKIFLGGAPISSNTFVGGENGLSNQTIIVCGYRDDLTNIGAWPGRGAVAYLTDGTLTDAEVAILHQILIDYLLTPTGRPYV